MHSLQDSPMLFFSQSFPKIQIWLLSYTHLQSFSSPPPPPHSRTQLHNGAPMAFTPWSQPAPHTPIQSPIFQPRDHSKVRRHSWLPASPLQPPVSPCSELLSPATLPAECLNSHSKTEASNLSSGKPYADVSTQTSHYGVPIAPQTNFQHRTSYTSPGFLVRYCLTANW